MERNCKLTIYKGMIQYLLESTNYTLKNIADHTGASIQHLRSIYIGDQVPLVFSSELQLIKLYHKISPCFVPRLQLLRLILPFR